MMKKLILILIFQILTQQTRIQKLETLFKKQYQNKALKQDESNLDFLDYVKLYNYPSQSHQITTEDGYILQYYQIQKKNQNQILSNLPVMYLQHGLIDSSDAWVINSEELAPAFYYANKGFDVWLGNMRGNSYSRNHNKFNPDKDKEYWYWSFDQMSQYDLTAAFQYIHNATNQKINYIGHSQGTTVMIIALIMNNQIVKSHLNNFAAFAPVAYLQNQNSKLIEIASNFYLVNLLKLFNVNELFSINHISSYFQSIVCQYLNIVCQDLFYLLADTDTSQNNVDRYNVFAGHFPKGSSLQNFQHFVQLTKGRFAQYDYGNTKENMKKYNQSNAPDYKISEMQSDVPLFFYIGLNDRLANKIDVDHFLEQTDSQKVNITSRIYKEYGHSTFYFGNKNNFQHIEQVLIDFGYQNLL